MEAFCARVLDDSEMAASADHIAGCAACQRLFQIILKREKRNRPLRISVSPADWFRHEHPEYDRLASLAEKRLDAEAAAIVNLHLETCSFCREDMRSIDGVAAAVGKEVQTRPAPAPEIITPAKPVTVKKASPNRWKPAYTIAALLVIGSAGLAAVLLSRQSSPEASGNPPVAASTVAPATPNPDVSSDGSTSALADGAMTIRFGESGIVSGLEAFPAEVQKDIADALLTGTIRKVMDLGRLASGQPVAGAPVIQYPRRIVITEDRPSFRWAPLAGASGYQVRVNEPAGNQVANSGQLPPEITQWRSPLSLRRGVIYSWTVTGVVNGEELVSVARFKLLEGSKLAELAALKDQYQSHLALGLFYLREGVLIEARREFQTLAKDNPDSPAAADLLRQAQSWR